VKEIISSGGHDPSKPWYRINME